MKVKFKPEVLEYIRNNNRQNSRWISVDMLGANEVYTKEFDIPYFIVNSECFFFGEYSIVEPIELSRYNICKNHVDICDGFEIKLDDELWNI